MSKKLKGYFAHPYKKRLSSNKYKIKAELKERGVEVIDPFIGEYKILRRHNIKEYYEAPNYKLAREIWLKDFQQVEMCNILVAWIPENLPVIGTTAELVHAHRFGKFIQIISPLKHPLFAYVLGKGNQQFETVKDFINRRRMIW